MTRRPTPILSCVVRTVGTVRASRAACRTARGLALAAGVSAGLLGCEPAADPTSPDGSAAPPSSDAASPNAASSDTAPASAATTTPPPPDAERPALPFVEHESPFGPDAIMTCGAMPSREILEVNGAGIALIDYDRDGDHDVFLANGATLDAPDAGPGSRLFRNDGDLQFTDVTAEAEITLARWATGVAVGDFDADGHDDLYVGCFGRDALLRNRGDGTFEDVTDAAGIDRIGWTTSVAFGDLDRDGDLDLYAVHYLDFDPARPPDRATYKGVSVLGGPHGQPAEHDIALENRGDGTFVDRTDDWGLRPPRPAYGLNAVLLDLDDDGRLDVLVGNDSQANFAFMGTDDGFVERGYATGLATNADGLEQATMGMAVADVNADTRPDVFSTNFSSDTNTLHASTGGAFWDDATRPSGLGIVSRPYLGWACWFADWDHDGDEDVFMVNGHVYPEATVELMDSAAAQPPLLFERVGRRFERRTDQPWLTMPRHDRSAAFGDLDRDGDLDIVVGPLNAPLRILESQAARPGAPDWVTIELHDARPGAPNPRGIGASMVVEHGDRTHRRWIIGGGGFQSSSAPEAHLGLPGGGDARVTVTWPDGHRTEHTIAAGRHHRLVRRD